MALTDCGRSSSKELSGDGKEALRNHLISICCNYTFSMEESGCHCSSKLTPNLECHDWIFLLSLMFEIFCNIVSYLRVRVKRVCLFSAGLIY